MLKSPRFKDWGRMYEAHILTMVGILGCELTVLFWEAAWVLIRNRK